MKIALFPGSFDPFTKGHYDVVLRGLKMFDKIVIAVGHNPTKSRYIDIDTMIQKIEEVFKETNLHVSPSNHYVKVIKYNELTAELAKKHGANFLLRGLRNTTDFEYENSISQVNRYLNKELETVFLITSPKVAWISSSIVREVHKHNGDISNFLPYTL